MHSRVNSLWLAVSVLSFLSNVGPAVTAPVIPLYDDVPFNFTHPFAGFGNTGTHKRDTPALRILSLGASIMSGTGSSTGNGCRKPLRDALRADGHDVNMVGSLHGGTMVDSDHEAVPGDVLTQVRARVPHSTGFKPNIVIINAGTNDGNENVDIPGAGSRMNDILNDLWAADGMADTCIMLSTLIPTTTTNGVANRDTINDQYRALVAERAVEGKCIYLADMDPGGEQWLQFDTDYVPTEIPHIHPNDAGHEKMAAVFFKAINQAIADGVIVAAGDFSVGASSCDKFAGTGIDAGGKTQRGWGYDDGIYSHDSEGLGILWTTDSQWDRNQWKFARLFDKNYDDLLAWISTSDTEQVYGVWANSADGKGSFTVISDMSPDLTCGADGVYFIDMNADGLDDLVCVSPSGDLYLSINQGDGNRAAGKPPTFKRVSDTALIKTNEGYERDRVVLADIDGDGRGDYGVIDDSGNVHFWRNGWVDDIPKYWQDLGVRFTGHTSGTQFEDINGDGRDDALYIDTDGTTYTYTNARSCKKGAQGDGLNVAWRQGFHTGATSGPTHLGMAEYLTDDETNLRGRVHFARIVGTSTVFGNLPKQDYVFMQHTKLDSGKHRFQMRVWKNTGAGGTKLLADGDKYCNMMGHTNGMMDYVWVWSTGEMVLFGNRGKGTISDSDPAGYWSSEGTIWTPPSDMNRRDLHLQDWDGDGVCDIIYADPNGGAVQVWINNYHKTGSWSWTHLDNPAPGLGCSQKRGLAVFDLGVRFADITGNKRADYLCLEPDGRTTGFVHGDDGSFENVGQIKFAEGYDRANLRWADVNGDGVDDLLWVDKFTGDGHVWYNQGRGDPADLAGSSFFWKKQTASAYVGNSAGTCEYFPDLDGNGRADEHYILGTFNNEARTSLNPSCGLTDHTGDDAVMDGTLPTVPGGDDGGGDDGGDGGDDSNLGDNSDYPSHYYPGGDWNCDADRNWFAPGTDVGNIDGGDSFCMAKWREGIFPKLLEATANVNALCSVRVVFTDDTEMTVGQPCADDGHHRMGTLEWTPFVDTWSKFSLWDTGYKNGVGRLVAGITNKDEIDAGKYFRSTPTRYDLSRGSDGQGVLLGFLGTAGDRIDSLQPLFSSAGPNIIRLTNATFNPSFETLNTLPFDQRGMTVISSPADFDNSQSSVSVEYSQNVKLEYQKMYKVTVSNEGGKELGGELATTVGYEHSWDIGVPQAAKTSGKTKVEVQAKFVGKHVDKHVDTEENDKTQTISVSTRIRVTLKPGEAVSCAATIVQSQVNLKYSAVLQFVFNDQNGYVVDVNGIYESATASQVVSYCMDGGLDGDIGTEDDNNIVMQGMYCQDGTYIGDWETDLTADEFAAICPDDWAAYE